MRALTVRPGTPNDVELSDLPEPDDEQGRVPVQGLAIGICGTDREIVAGEYGEAPPGAGRLVLGHEASVVSCRTPPVNCPRVTSWSGSSAGPTPCRA